MGLRSVLALALATGAGAQMLAAGLDSRSFPPSSWYCDGGVQLSFGNSPVSCGVEVGMAATASPPTVILPSANLSATYTVLLIDRDSSASEAPGFAPLALFAVSGVGGAVMQRGYSLAAGEGRVPWCVHGLTLHVLHFDAELTLLATAQGKLHCANAARWIRLPQDIPGASPLPTSAGTSSRFSLGGRKKCFQSCRWFTKNQWAKI